MTLPDSERGVVITDIHMSFGSMVIFIIKWTTASIPAMIILVILFGVVAAVFGGLFAGMTGGFG